MSRSKTIVYMLHLVVMTTFTCFKLGIVDARTLNSSAIASAVCSKVDAGEVTLCLEPMIQLSEELARKNALVNRIIFPLFNFELKDMKRICQIWTEMHATCLSQDLITRCAHHGLLKILKALFTFSCTDSTTKQFFDQYSCIGEVVVTHQKCVDFMMVSTDPALRPSSKCDPVPSYYSCLEQSVFNRCHLAGLTVFRLTLETFGCHPPVLHPQLQLDKQSGRGILISSTDETDQSRVEPNNHAQAITSESFVTEQKLNSRQDGDKSQSNNADDIAALVETTAPLFRQTSLLEVQTANRKKSISTTTLKTTVIVAETTESFQEELTVLPDDIVHQNLQELSAESNVPVSNKILEVEQEHKFQRIIPSPPFDDNNIQIVAQRPVEKSDIKPVEHQLSAYATPSQLTQFTNNFETFENNDIISSLQTCPETIRNRARTCLQPVMAMWHQLAQKQPLLSNVTFPLFLMDREQVLDLCDLYASAFLDCRLVTFQICSQDPIVEFSDAMLGYACGNAIEFFRSYDCLSVISQDSGSLECRRKIQIGISEDFDRRCAGIKEFYLCIQETVEAICPHKTLKILREAINYYGCHV